MEKSLNILFLVIVFVSCKSSQETILNAKKPINVISIDTNTIEKGSEVDLLFHSIIDAELNELGRGFAVVDRTVGPTSVEMDGFEMLSPENKENIIWNRDSFTQIKYINGEIVMDYKRNDINKYYKLINRYGRKGWIELHTPKFSANKKMVLIELNYYRGRHFNRVNYYLFEKQKGQYKMVKMAIMK